tara:strand:- start:29 stop:379 length:351 start_codon:yes stop_codon:yes gene_type:complete
MLPSILRENFLSTTRTQKDILPGSEDSEGAVILKCMRHLLTTLILVITVLTTTSVFAKDPKAKFYDFADQLIDGEIKKPTTLYTDARQAVRFDRLLKLKKSFLPNLYKTAKDPIFR